MKPSDVLNAAAEQIIERGWNQGDFVGSDGESLCAMGAVRIAAGGGVTLRDSHYTVDMRLAPLNAGRLADRACRYLHEEINNQTGYEIYPVGDWNDDRDRTVTEVITTLYAAAIRAKEAGD